MPLSPLVEEHYCVIAYCYGLVIVIPDKRGGLCSLQGSGVICCGTIKRVKLLEEL